MRTLVVVPTYQEALNIESVLLQIRASAPTADILIIDDGSPDGTAEVAESLARQLGQIEVLRRPGKQGLGSAYRLGFETGLLRGYDVLAGMDADLSHDPASLPDLLQAVADGADLAVGSRYTEGGSIPDWPRSRRALSRYGNRYASMMLSMNVKDATTGFRAYRSSLVEQLDLDKIRAEGYGFLIEMTYRTSFLGKRIVEVPISFNDRTQGKSKMSSRIIIEAMILVTGWGLRDRLFRRRRFSGRADS